MLPRQELVEGSRHREALEAILDTAEQALRSWTPCWSGFIDGAVREDAEARLATLAERSRTPGSILADAITHMQNAVDGFHQVVDEYWGPRAERRLAELKAQAQ
jgi:hypothetical protein